jgi:hypothetical protein
MYSLTPVAVQLAAVCAGLIALAAPAVPAEKFTVDQAISIVRSDLASKHDDKATAKAISKLFLVERLDPVVVEYLESEGAGPRTLEELEKLADATRGMPPPTPPPSFKHPPIPTRDEMTAAIGHARRFAYQYAASLPDFLCDETVTRYENTGPRGWVKVDTMGLRLNYEDREEKANLMTMYGRATIVPLSSVAGARTAGEFGGLMFQVLDYTAKGKFRWDHWTLLRNRYTQVYSYRVDAEDSKYNLVFGGLYNRIETVPAMEGFLYLDGETNDITRIANHAVDIKPGFPVTRAATRVDYAKQAVGGKEYILPLRSETRMDTATIHTRNFSEFSGYRKFAGDSTITFGDDADAPPAPKTIKH